MEEPDPGIPVTWAFLAPNDWQGIRNPEVHPGSKQSDVHSDDRKAAMTQAKLGETPEPRDCPNPFIEHLQLANRLGLTGTPMTVTDSGEHFNAHLPADSLVARPEAAKQAPSH